MKNGKNFQSFIKNWKMYIKIYFDEMVKRGVVGKNTPGKDFNYSLLNSAQLPSETKISFFSDVPFWKDPNPQLPWPDITAGDRGFLPHLHAT